MTAPSKASNDAVDAIKKYAKEHAGEFLTMHTVVAELGLNKNALATNIKNRVMKELEQEGHSVEKQLGKGFRVKQQKASAYEIKTNEPSLSIRLKEKPLPVLEIDKLPAVPAFFAEAIHAMGDDTHILIYNKKQAKLIGPNITQYFDAEEIDFNCKYTKEQGVTVDMKITNSYKF